VCCRAKRGLVALGTHPASCARREPLNGGLAVSVDRTRVIRIARLGPELDRQTGTWPDYTEIKLISDCLPIRQVTRAISPTGRFNRSDLPPFLGLRVSKSRFS
jgi:hypothetical protein